MRALHRAAVAPPLRRDRRLLRLQSGRRAQLETVFVLFRPTKHGLASHNRMIASEPLNRGYGVWVAGKAEVTVAYNEVKNMQYGICIATDGLAAVVHNALSMEGSAADFETVGISAPQQDALTETQNLFAGFRRDVLIGGQPPATQKS